MSIRKRMAHVITLFVGHLAIISTPTNAIASARYGVHGSKIALMHGPNWVMVFIASVAAIFLISVLVGLHEDSKDVTDSKEKRDVNLMKLYFFAGILGCLWVVLSAVFG